MSAETVCAPCLEGDHDECKGYQPCMCIDMEHDDDE